MSDLNKFNLLEFRFNFGAQIVLNELNFTLSHFNFGLILTTVLMVCLKLMR